MDANTAATLRPWFPDMELERVRLVHSGPMSWFVRSVLRQGAMTLSPFVFFGRHDYDATSPRSLALLAHELLHIRQYRDMGHVRFLFTYMRDRIKAGSYSRDLPLEQPAYALQAEVRETLEHGDEAVER